ncbi:hypothetical protein SteCoe_24339 [Stentor coeruleus]|uniref:Uncharacterized protein n=1 Tax=Stentor coeruleus TaxID=5963 RepID=A0A1R2BHQ4_9CILI|nr:hypothetical protein SteCoe_24339 [Stentor coeruleus]
MSRLEVSENRRQLKSFEASKTDRSIKNSRSNILKKKHSKSPYELLSTARLQRLQKNITNSGYLSLEPIENSVIPQVNIEPRLDKFTKSLEQKKVPQTIIENYHNIIKSLQSHEALKFINSEQEGFDKKNSFLLSSLHAAKAWQESLFTIKEMCGYLSENSEWFKLKNVVKECSESLTSHILLAINLVNCVKSWKDSINSKFFSGKKFVSFNYTNDDIYTELISSCDFLSETPISLLFPVAKSDPFLIAITKEIPSDKLKSIKPKRIHKILVEKGKVYILLPKEVIGQTTKLHHEIITVNENFTVDASKFISKPLLNLLNKRKIQDHKSKENRKIASLYCERYLSEVQVKILQEIALEVINDYFAQHILSKYINIINDMAKDIILSTVMEMQNLIGSEKAKKFHNANTIEAIVRNLIESEINNQNIKTMCEEIIESEIQEKTKNTRNSIAQQRLSRISKNMEYERLAEMIYNGLVDHFVAEEWVELIATSGLGISRKKSLINNKINNKHVEEEEDFALEIFTPGVHSPNEVRSRTGSIMSDAKNLQGNEILKTESNIPEGKNEGLSERKLFYQVKTLKNCRFREVCESEENFKIVYFEYVRGLSEEYQNLFVEYEMMLEEIENANNTKYYWLMVDEKISGLIIYSLKDLNSIIHHLSFTNFSIYPDLIANISSIIPFNPPNLIFQFKTTDLNPIITKVLKKKGFNHDPLKKHIAEFKVKSSQPSALLNTIFKIFINAHTILETSQTAQLSNKLSSEMIEVGNRHCLISNILSTFQAKTTILELHNDTSVRLQRDVNEMLDIIISLNFLQYPIIKNYTNITAEEIQKICKENNIKANYSVNNTANMSILPINIDVIGCSFITKFHEKNKYKYMRFKSKKICVQKGPGGTNMYVIPTNNTEISIFFIKSPNLIQELTQGIKHGKTDLFYNIDSLIKTLNSSETFTDELWVPCFSKSMEWSIPWIEGFRTDSEKVDFVVSACQESIFVMMDYAIEENKSIVYMVNEDYIFKETFVFGVFHKEIREKLDSPFFVALVKPEQWIKYT